MTELIKELNEGAIPDAAGRSTFVPEQKGGHPWPPLSTVRAQSRECPPNVFAHEPEPEDHCILCQMFRDGYPLHLPGAWAGWTIKRIGRRKAESLLAPDGSTYCPEEILELRRVWMDLDYFQVETKRLRMLVEAHALHITPGQIEILQRAQRVIGDLLPSATTRGLMREDDRAPLCVLNSSLETGVPLRGTPVSKTR